MGTVGDSTDLTGRMMIAERRHGLIVAPFLFEGSGHTLRNKPGPRGLKAVC
jgi:hypothetical protein